MSDVFEGPGWWIASDGKWYSPARHPDEEYRNRFLPVEPEPEPEPVVAADPPPVHADTETFERPSFPTVELHADSAPASTPDVQTETTITAPVDDVARAAELETAEISAAQLQAQLAEVERQRIAEAARRLLEAENEPPVAPAERVDVAPPAAATFSVSTPSSPPATERPIFDDARPASVVEAPVREPLRQHTGRSKLEVDKLPDLETLRPSEGTLTPSSVTASIAAAPTSTALVHLPATTTGTATVRDRVIAGFIFTSGIAMIVGTFLNWTTGTVVQTGWDRGDGIVTVAAGVVGSAMAGPIFVGFRHMIPKSLAVIAGLLGLVVVGLAAITGVLDTSTAGIFLGVGFYVVLGGAIVMAAAAIADQGDSLG